MNDGISLTPGWQLVPVEPTKEMLDAPSTVVQAYAAKLIYRRMLAAAPTPASREQAEQQDSSHFAANGDEAKSLQPLLDDGGPESFRAQEPFRRLVEAWLREEFGGVEADNVGKTEFTAYVRLAQKAAGLRAKEWIVAQQHPTRPEVSIFTTSHERVANEYERIGWTVSGPARQEERSSEKEVGAAPLPAQGQEAEDLNEQFGNVFESLIVAGFDPADAKVAALVVVALRASSAPTTKG